jgi:chemotaxis protein CheY-P-specific phosphatase CheC
MRYLDMLKEIGKIGGNAASALSEMIGMTVDISVPKLRWILLRIDQHHRDPEHVLLGILYCMSGDMDRLPLWRRSWKMRRRP